MKIVKSFHPDHHRSNNSQIVDREDFSKNHIRYSLKKEERYLVDVTSNILLELAVSLPTKDFLSNSASMTTYQKL